MIIDLEKFTAAERGTWDELEGLLNQLENPGFKLTLQKARRLQYLYERTAADLAKLVTFSSEPELRRYLENLVGRAYGLIHEDRSGRQRFRPLRWLLQTFPQTFRRHARAFAFSVAVTVAGCLFGGLALGLDADSKAVIMPFEHLQGDPSERVAWEQSAQQDRLAGAKTTFSSELMTHNTRVSIMTMAMGMTWGIGTIILLFYNGVILGAVAIDYILAGEVRFLLGWLMPHGTVEIPAILIAGQAGLVLAKALVGWGSRISLAARLRAISGDLATLIFGVALMLVWAGIIEAFLSQYHEPVLPYSAKIAFGSVEMILLALFLARAGRAKPKSAE